MTRISLHEVLREVALSNPTAEKGIVTADVLINDSVMCGLINNMLSTYAHKCPWCGANPVQKQYNEDGEAFCTRCLHRAI